MASAFQHDKRAIKSWLSDYYSLWIGWTPHFACMYLESISDLNKGRFVFMMVGMPSSQPSCIALKRVTRQKHA